MRIELRYVLTRLVHHCLIHRHTGRLHPVAQEVAGECFTGRADLVFPAPGARVESCAYRMAGVDPSREMDWKKYLAAVLLFNAAGFLILFLSLCQKWLPLNPAGTENMRWDIAFNTAVSFMTNTNWQFYSGEGGRRASATLCR